MVGKALEVMPFAMHLRLSFTNALPCNKTKNRRELLFTFFHWWLHPLIFIFGSEREACAVN